MKNRTIRPICTFICLTLFAAATCFAEPPAKTDPLNLWPGTAPGEKEQLDEEKPLPNVPGEKKIVVRLTNVTTPTITICKPPADKDTGAAVVVCPGGGYSILAMDLEGEEIVAWLNDIGVTGILLKYRVPRRKDLPKHQAPLQDAQRALRLARQNAEEWEIDPNRIGIMGFSAGGHLSAAASTNFNQPAYEPIDDADKLSCRPDFTMLIYPAYLVDENDATKTAPELPITSDMPPVISIITGDDNYAISAIPFYMALQKAKVPAEMHVYPKGGHGYGLRPSGNAVSSWPKRCEDWMRQIGMFKAADGFEPLFNGQDLTGWEGAEGLWTVEDGVIVGSSEKTKLKHNTFLATKESFGDFTLRVKVNLRNHNSGVQFRSERKPDHVVIGYQADVAEKTYFGMLYEEGKRGFMPYWKALSPEQRAAIPAAAKPLGEWNEFEITCRGDHLKMTLNGFVTLDIDDPDGAKSGVVGLQLHAGDPMEVRFKDISIKRLSTEK